jgi:hypothetical protein
MKNCVISDEHDRCLCTVSVSITGMGLDLMFARWKRCCGIWSNVPWRGEDSGKYMYFVRFCGSITRLDIADQMPGGSDRRLIFLSPTGPYRHRYFLAQQGPTGTWVSPGKAWSKRAEILKPHLKQSGPGLTQSRTGRTIRNPDRM